MKKITTLIVALSLCAGMAYSQTYKMQKDVIASGATVSSNASFTMYGTIGQAVIGPTGGAGHVVYQGFWYDTSRTTGIAVTQTGLPGDFQLFQNYPNPFNPSTTIKFSVPSRTHVVLRVISMTGALVKTLVDDNVSAGEYSVVFQANEIPTGSYFYTLEAGNHMMTKRMILIK